MYQDECELCENDIFCDLNNGFKFKNVNENVENIKWEFDFYDYGVLSVPTPSATPAPPIIFDFINSRAGLREKIDLKCIFGVNNNGNNFNIVNEINNENFCNNGYYGYCEYSTTPPRTPQIIFIYNETGNELPGFNIYLCENGLVSCENNVINEICNGMINGM